MTYYFLVENFAAGSPNNMTNGWVFTSCSIPGFHLDKLGDVWKGRLSGLLLSGWLFDFLVKDNAFSIAQYFRLFGLYQSVWLFLLFLLLDPFLNFVEQAGGYAALTRLMQPLVNLGGRRVVVISGGVLGAFGFSGANVAILKMLHELFTPLLVKHAIPMFAWAVALVAWDLAYYWNHRAGHRVRLPTQDRPHSQNLPPRLPRQPAGPK